MFQPGGDFPPLLRFSKLTNTGSPVSLAGAAAAAAVFPQK